MAPNKRNWNLALTLRDGSASGRSTYRFALPVTNDVLADRDPFTVRSSTSNSLSSLTDYGAIAQQSFHNGVGFDKLTDTSGYKIGQSVDARIPGITTIFPGPRVVSNAGLSPVRWNSSLEQVVPFAVKTLFSNSYVRILMGGEGGVRAVNPIPYDSWQASKLYKKHDIVLPTTPANHIYVNRGSGTSGATEPTWVATAGSNTSDGTTSWVAQSMTYIHDIKWGTHLTNEYSVLDMWGSYRPLVGLFGEVMLKFTGNMDRYEGIWSPNRPYQLGDFVTRTSHAGYFFEATTVASNGFSGGSEPAWSATVGGTVVNGDITWTTRDYWERVNGDESWAPSTTYNTGDIVRPRTLTSSITGFYYELTTTATSGGTEPAWNTTVGGTVVDNDITWTTRQYEKWEATTRYVLGDRVRKRGSNDNAILEVVAVTGDGLSSETEPTWDAVANQQTTDNQLTWKTILVEWTASTAYEIGDLITADTTPGVGDGLYFEATVAVAGTSHASTEPTWATTEGGTSSDNGLTWTARLERDAPKDAGCFTDFDGYIFYNQHFLTGSDNARVLVGSLAHYFASTDGQDAAGFTNEDETHPLYRTQGDPGAIQVGTAYKRVRKLVPFNQVLYALCSDAIYYIQQVDGVFEARRLDIGGIGLQAHRDNFVIGLEWNGSLWFNVRNKLYRYSGANLADATPPIYDREVYPPKRPLRLHSAVGVGKFLYLVADDDLWCTDGTAWHRLSRIPDSSNKIVQATIGWQEANYNNPAHLFILARTTPITADDTNSYEEAAGETSQIYFWTFDEDTDYPVQDTFRNDYSSTTIGELVTVDLDAGFESVAKAYISLVVKAGIYSVPVNATLNGWSDARIEVYANTRQSVVTDKTGGGELNDVRIDRDSSTLARLGAAYNMGVRGLTASGATYIEFVRNLIVPFQTDNSPNMYSDPFTGALGMSFTFKLKAGTLSTSRTPVIPVLLGYEARVVVRPDFSVGLTITLPIADNAWMTDGEKQPLTAKRQREILLQARDEVIPIYVDDLTQRKTGWFYISSIRFQNTNKNENHRATEEVEGYAALSLVEIVTNTTDF